jgi:uncharacterized protein YdeI (YjbR/CyaY-like superfamily)
MALMMTIRLVYRTVNVKTPAVRARRIAELVELLARGKGLSTGAR